VEGRRAVVCLVVHRQTSQPFRAISTNTVDDAGTSTLSPCSRSLEADLIGAGALQRLFQWWDPPSVQRRWSLLVRLTDWKTGALASFYGVFIYQSIQLCLVKVGGARPLKVVLLIAKKQFRLVADNRKWFWVVNVGSRVSIPTGVCPYRLLNTCRCPVSIRKCKVGKYRTLKHGKECTQA